VLGRWVLFGVAPQDQSQHKKSKDDRRARKDDVQSDRVLQHTRVS